MAKFLADCDIAPFSLPLLYYGTFEKRSIIMAGLTVEQALENIYASLENNNEDIDSHIAALKDALPEGQKKTVAVDTARLAQNNRQGRKMMEAYFKKRGVIVTFSS